MRWQPSFAYWDENKKVFLGSKPSWKLIYVQAYWNLTLEYSFDIGISGLACGLLVIANNSELGNEVQSWAKIKPLDLPLLAIFLVISSLYLSFFSLFLSSCNFQDQERCKLTKFILNLLFNLRVNSNYFYYFYIFPLLQFPPQSKKTVIQV